MNRALIFDCFGVIVNEVSIIWFNQHFSSEQVDQIENTIASRVNTGEISADEFYRELSIMSGIAPSQIKSEWASLAKVDTEVVSLITHCHASHKIGLLSNGFNPFLRDIFRINGLEKYFDDIIISCEVGLKKPDPRMFALAMERLQTSPAESIFIDDRVENINAAKAFGMYGILYRSYAQLKHDLLTRNIQI